MANVATPTKRYEELHEKCDLPRALMGGTAEMIEEGEEFLPRHPAESETAYNVRLRGTTLYNGFQDTVKKMCGKVFSKPIQIGEDVSPQVIQYLPNIDGAGRDHNAFFYDTFKEAIVDGISFVYVDFPVVVTTAGLSQPTMADQIAQGARPYTILVVAENLIGWKSENIGGVQVLTEARIKEEITIPDGEWGEKEVEQVRLLRRGSFEVHRKNIEQDGKVIWRLESSGTTSLSYIPLIPVYINRVGFFEGEPPLLPLAELNLEHWISSSEQRKALTFARFAMLALIGVDSESEVEVGPDKVLKLPQGATAQYVESTGNGVSAGRADLEAIEKRMQHAGMTVRVQTASGVTATAAAIDSADADAALMAAGKALQDSVDQVLQVFADYLRIPDGGTSLVDTSFGKAMAQGTTAELLQLYMAGVFDLTTLLTELKRRGIIADETDIQALVNANSSVV